MAMVLKNKSLKRIEKSIQKVSREYKKVFKKDGISENGWTLQYKHIMGSKIKEWLVLSKTKKSPY